MSKIREALEEYDIRERERTIKRNRKEAVTDMIEFTVVNIMQASAVGVALWFLVGMLKA